MHPTRTPFATPAAPDRGAVHSFPADRIQRIVPAADQVLIRYRGRNHVYANLEALKAEVITQELNARAWARDDRRRQSAEACLGLARRAADIVLALAFALAGLLLLGHSLAVAVRL